MLRESGDRVTRSIRRAFELFAASSLLLCLATACVWFATRHGPLFFRDGDASSISAQYGDLNFRWDTPYQPAPQNAATFVTAEHWTWFYHYVQLHSAVASIDDYAGSFSVRMVQNVSTRLYVRLWAIGLAFAIAPAAWILRFAMKRRIKPGCCAACGYDLTGNISGVCPECGMKTAPSEPAATSRSAR